MREQAIIVDRDDNVLYFKDKDTITPDEIWRMVLVWIENRTGDVLITRRSLTKKVFPGMWEPAAAGSVMPHESYEEAAHRELKEETGLGPIALTHVRTTYLEIPEHGQRMIGWFKGQTDAKIEELQLEHEAVMDAKFINKEELLADYDKQPEAYPASAVFWRELFN